MIGQSSSSFVRVLSDAKLKADVTYLNHHIDSTRPPGDYNRFSNKVEGLFPKNGKRIVQTQCYKDLTFLQVDSDYTVGGMTSI
jgi:hypothetical protein